jgi:hypothetical protein
MDFTHSSSAVDKPGSATNESIKNRFASGEAGTQTTEESGEKISALS